MKIFFGQIVNIENGMKTPIHKNERRPKSRRRLQARSEIELLQFFVSGDQIGAPMSFERWYGPWNNDYLKPYYRPIEYAR